MEANINGQKYEITYLSRNLFWLIVILLIVLIALVIIVIFLIGYFDLPSQTSKFFQDVHFISDFYRLNLQLALQGGIS